MGLCNSYCFFHRSLRVFSVEVPLWFWVVHCFLGMFFDLLAEMFLINVVAFVFTVMVLFFLRVQFFIVMSVFCFEAMP